MNDYDFEIYERVCGSCGVGGCNCDYDTISGCEYDCDNGEEDESEN